MFLMSLIWLFFFQIFEERYPALGHLVLIISKIKNLMNIFAKRSNFAEIFIFKFFCHVEIECNKKNIGS